MKYIFCRNWLIMLVLAALLPMAGCVKSKDQTFTDFSKVSDLVILQNAGLANFDGSNIIITPASHDTLLLDVYAALASVYPSNSAITVKLGINDAARTAYNTSNRTNYQAFTNNMYKLLTNTITLPVGQHYVKTTLEVYKNFVDVTKSWMLPITITDASGKALSSNQNILYFHIIGNPMAGPYKVTGTRYNYNGPAVGTPASTNNLAASKTALPISETTISLDYANVGGGWGYEITFDATYTKITNTVANATILAGVQSGTFALTAPTEYDPLTKTIKLHTSYTNTSGNARLIDEVFVKQ